MNLHSPTLSGPFQHLNLSPLHRAFDTGGQGGGGDTGVGTDAGGGGQPDSGGQGQRTSYGGQRGQRGAGTERQGQGGDQRGSAYKLTDDALVDLGDGKPVKWSEARQRYVPADEHQRLTKTFNDSKQLLHDYAKQLDEGFARLQQQQGRGQQQPPPTVDPLEALENEPIVDGRTMAKLLRDLRANGLGRVAQVVAQQQAALTDLTKKLEGLTGAAGTLTEHHQSQQFENFLTDHLENLGEVKGLTGPIDAKHPWVREIARDLWLSYDQKTWTPTDYRKMLGERIAQGIDFVLQHQRKVVEEAKNKKRQFFQPGRGQSQGGGEGGRFQFKKGMQIARESGIFDRGAAV